MILAHMGKLHPYEQGLVLLLAFGPILVLAITVWVHRRRSNDEDEQGLDQ